MGVVVRLRPPCAACGAPTSGRYSVHRDGFCEGPEVDVCDACGGDVLPTLEDLWAAIRVRRRGRRA